MSRKILTLNYFLYSFCYIISMKHKYKCIAYKPVYITDLDLVITPNEVFFLSDFEQRLKIIQNLKKDGFITSDSATAESLEKLYAVKLKKLLPKNFNNYPWQKKKTFIKNELEDTDLLRYFAFSSFKSIRDAARTKLKAKNITIS